MPAVPVGCNMSMVTKELEHEPISAERRQASLNGSVTFARGQHWNLSALYDKYEVYIEYNRSVLIR